MNRRKYVSLNSLSQLQKRMLEDDEFFDVSPEEVSVLLRKMTARRCSREEIIRIRKKYAIWLNDKESQLMAELGLDYDTHAIDKKPKEYGLSLSQQEFTIDGYRVPEWRMLTDDDFVPTIFQLKQARERLSKIGDTDALETLDMKYKYLFDNQVQRILKRNSLPLDIAYESLTHKHIDGITFYLWRLINDDGFIPKKRGNLVSTIRQLRKKDMFETADFLEDKYYQFLYPDRDILNHEKEIADAKDYFRDLFPNRNLTFDS